MNIFYLDADPAACARSHADRHVVKMAVETTQILCSAYYFTGESLRSPYKLTHANHPCCVWARASLSNWLWLKSLGLELCREYTYRYGRVHRCEAILNSLVPPALEDIGFTPPKSVMDEEFIVGDDPIENYRSYYRHGKRHLLCWRRRGTPDWLYEGRDAHCPPET